MGEHLPCKQGVKSSNLSISIWLKKFNHLMNMYLENRIWKIQNIKWFNQKIVTMPIETSEEVIFNR